MDVSVPEWRADRGGDESPNATQKSVARCRTDDGVQVGVETGMCPETVGKIKGFVQQMLTSIENRQRVGVKVRLGTDLFGTTYQDQQANEFRFRADVNEPFDIRRSATSINAEIMQRKDEPGVMVPGAKAGMIVLDGNPLTDVSCFDKFKTDMPVVIRSGALERNTLL